MMFFSSFCCPPPSCLPLPAPLLPPAPPSCLSVPPFLAQVLTQWLILAASLKSKVASTKDSPVS